MSTELAMGDPPPFVPNANDMLLDASPSLIDEFIVGPSIERLKKKLLGEETNIVIVDEVGDLQLATPLAPITDVAMLGTSGYERNARDLYATPADVSQALMRVLVERSWIEPGDVIWEPACGDWKLAGVMEEFGFDVVGSDIEPLDDRGVQADFINMTVKTQFDAIITNPPFGVEGGASIDDFIERGIQHIVRGNCNLVVMLGRNELDCGSGRSDVFGECPFFAAKIVLTFRPRWIEGSKGSPRHNYAWYVWAAEDHPAARQGDPRTIYAGRE